MRDDDPPEPQLSGRDAASLEVVRRLNAAVAASQPFNAAAEFAQAAAKHPGSTPSLPVVVVMMRKRQ